MIITKAKRSYESLLFQVSMLTTTRTVINTGHRMVYPLLPVFARSVGVEITSIATVLAFTQLLGLSAPFIGTISERQGRKFTILLGMAIYVVGMLAVFVIPNFTGLAIALLAAALGKIAFDPALQAYIGDRIPYERRGLFLGIVEFAWSGAFLIGVPAMTWLVAQYNWQAPFAALAILTTIGFIAAFFMIESDKPEAHEKASFLATVRSALNSHAALAGLVLVFSINAATQLVYVVFGTWIESSFGIMLGALAAASAVIGAAELTGEGLVAFASDKFGKRRLVMLGIIGNTIACLILPFMNFHLTAVLVGLFLFYIGFELSVVAFIPMATEISPHARAMYITLIVACATFGRALFTPVAPYLFENFGLLANCLLAIGLNAVAIFVLWKFIRIK
jgi:predicted MFS family arabinose efflux permease